MVYPDGKKAPYKKTLTGYQALEGFYEQLIQEQDGSYTLIFKDQTKFKYSASGKLLALTDRNGNQLTLSKRQTKPTCEAGLAHEIIFLRIDVRRIFL
ncbi:hypothetical protein [Ferviditalea candida]|uniref:hypothetical protein n=1 Tax=Ferviditalea candida TaxID=3108399 RepID=UPI00352BDB71